MSSTQVDRWPRITVWGHLWRALLATGTGVVLLGMALDPTVSLPVREQVYLRDLLVGVLALLLLPLHRRHPVVSVLLQAATAVSVSALGPAAVALASVATRRRWRPLAVNLVVAVVASWLSRGLYPAIDPLPLGVEAAGALLILAINVGWGMYVGARRDLLATWRWRAETAEREQAERVLAAQRDERARIAREMHDVLAHRISLISMHAGALAYREDLSAAEVRAEAELIQRTSAEALQELRGILGVLRGAGLEASTDTPQPTLADLPGLLEDARAARLRVEVRDELSVVPVPPQLGRHAYRILQEALTNVRKHAPGARARVDLTGTPGSELRLEVVNSSVPAWRPPGAPLPGAGLGLVGVAERAHIVGGSIEHGPTPEGGYRLVASLPWPEEAA
ncbi:sensor histidine kinase [Arsenicicoccus dermatophilus]|uniref:sensor histidine kinase n=1 Tax=Arsenicicoccus dermatophilus TaxID=1076331 RepID=UPI0039174CAF